MNFRLGNLSRAGEEIEVAAFFRLQHALGVLGFWLHLVIILTFGNFLPYGKHFHIITGLPNVYVRALPPASSALRKPNPTACSTVLSSRRRVVESQAVPAS